jgi:hypothetical protein
MRKLLHKERGRKFTKEVDVAFDKENQEIKRQEMNRSIKRIKKIKNIGTFSNYLLGLVLILLFFISLPETNPLWVRILIIIPSLIIFYAGPKAIKLLAEEKRKKFLEETDETFDKEKLVDEHKTILKDLKNELKGRRTNRLQKN